MKTRSIRGEYRKRREVQEQAERMEAAVYGDHIKTFVLLGATFDIEKARQMIASGDMVDKGRIALRDIWKWINVIDIDQGYASNLPPERLEVPVIVAKFADEDLLVDGYHRLTKAIDLGLETLPFASVYGHDILSQGERA